MPGFEPYTENQYRAAMRRAERMRDREDPNYERFMDEFVNRCTESQWERADRRWNGEARESQAEPIPPDVAQIVGAPESEYMRLSRDYDNLSGRLINLTEQHAAEIADLRAAHFAEAARIAEDYAAAARSIPPDRDPLRAERYWLAAAADAIAERLRAAGRALEEQQDG